MQLPGTPPPPPLAPLWDRVLRARALPPDLDVDLLYVAIRDRLVHPEWEVRLHALRVLADLLPLSGNALSFPFDQVIDNLGHGSPNVRKAALDALKVFCTYCEDTECAASAIIDKCSYNNIRPLSSGFDTKVNVITGLVLSIPSVMAILKRRNPGLDMFPVFNILGDKLFESLHRDVALRSLMKLRRICGPRDYMLAFSRLDPKVQEKFRVLCDKFDEDSLDVYYAPRRSYGNRNSQHTKMNHNFNNNNFKAPIRFPSDSSSEESYAMPYYTNNYGKVIIETEIKFDSDTAITMTVLEQNETESEKNTGSDDDDSIDRNMLKYSDDESEDSDVVVKKVRFGGESVKIRTPDSDNITSEEDTNHNSTMREKSIDVVLPTTPNIINKMNEIKRETVDREFRTNSKKSAIPLPVIHNRTRKQNDLINNNTIKSKSKSLSELYDYFNKKTDGENAKSRDTSKFALTLSEVRSPEKIPSPVETHKEVEVLHNLQRSPSVSPRRQQTRVHIEKDGFVLNLVATSPPESLLLSPRAASPLRRRYDWEELDIVPPHVCDQLHNTENWIAAVRAADQLHSALLEAGSVRRAEPAALSLVQHMWALSDAVPATRAPAEGAVCALVRGVSSSCARQLLPALITRIARDPPPAALPHALLQRLALHHLIDLIFDSDMIGLRDGKQAESAQLRAALCLARAAGPAAVMAAVRRRLAGSMRADAFCRQLRERLNKPIENIRPSHFSRSSQLPVPTRRARSTPPAAPPTKPRRLRPLPDSAPLPGVTQGRDVIMKPLSPIELSDKDSSSLTNTANEKETTPTVATPIESEDKLPENKDDEKDETQVAQEDSVPTPPKSPSLQIEDVSDKSTPSLRSEKIKTDDLPTDSVKETIEAQKSSVETIESIELEQLSGKSSVVSKSKSEPSSPIKSARLTPELARESSGRRSLGERDVRTALAECIMPARHEDWEAIVTGLIETEQMAMDITARAPASSWRAATRAAATHVRSLRSKVARAACSTLGALFEHRGRTLDPELDEATGALLERCADVNRFLRADATSALRRIACGGVGARAAVALARRGAAHRAGPVRAAAAQALAALVRHNGASPMLDMPVEPRTLLLRATGELLGDASAEARAHARHLWIALAEDSRFPQMLKDAMPPTRYRAIEKYVDKLRCR
ncbi:PREDICTED: uncharacterized protein LOC106123404 [Papilio xuthus]|uniref:Uncharacterized protein LOC106123404 n=1 Tax=Papilio xuthus TaxID=66420 RepID=A0AAJ6ZLK8_PAPXU|nr:PREDICTED: uncharacterized protein LOC106123404 [Papilio xuthus]